MRAENLSEPYPSIDVSAPALAAARTIGEERRPAVVVLDRGKPFAVLAGSQVLRFLIPGYLQEDPSLVRVYDEKTADECVRRLDNKSVGDLVHHDKKIELPVVDGDATVLECAAVMAKLHSPLLVVVDAEGQMTGAITASRLLEKLIVEAP